MRTLSAAAIFLQLHRNLRLDKLHIESYGLHQSKVQIGTTIGTELLRLVVVDGDRVVLVLVDVDGDRRTEVLTEIGLSEVFQHVKRERLSGDVVFRAARPQHIACDLKLDCFGQADDCLEAGSGPVPLGSTS